MKPFITVRDHTILSTLLGRDSVVIDAGSNRGEFAREMVARFDCQVLAVEPTPALIAGYPTHPKITLIHAALGKENGFIDFHLSDNSEASSTRQISGIHSGLPVRVPTISLESLLDRTPAGRADLCKMDIEGAEIEVLNGSSAALLSRIDQLTVEFHDFMGHNTRAQTDRCIEHVRDAGFIIHQYQGATDNVLMINKRLVSPTKYVFLRLANSVRSRIGG